MLGGFSVLFEAPLEKVKIVTDDSGGLRLRPQENEETKQIVIIKKNGKWEDISFSESTDVSFYPVSDEEIRTYIASGEPMDKAGSYGIQGGFGIYVKEIRGEYTNVVGLPVGRLFYEMKKHGIELRG